MSRTAFPGAEIPQAIDGPAASVYGGARGLTDAEIIDAEIPIGAEPALWLVLKESEARKMVNALEKGHAYEVVAILKSQPWWPELSAATRGLAHRDCFRAVA